jgi:hypothetical protein
MDWFLYIRHSVTYMQVFKWSAILTAIHGKRLFYLQEWKKQKQTIYFELFLFFLEL